MKSNAALPRPCTTLKPKLGQESFLESPVIWHFAKVTSTQDVATRLYQRGQLKAWDSVLASLQSQGRGQRRRSWSSAFGNLHVSLCLPKISPFTEDWAGPFLGLLLAKALALLGLELLIKWPNDLVAQTASGPAKLGGLLLEERGDLLLLGLGLNLKVKPDLSELRVDHALPATTLVELGLAETSPCSFWLTLVRNIFTVYKDEKSSFPSWREQLTSRLLWQGRKVALVEQNEENIGLLRGIGPG
ncbi:MAG: biotin--acetyl-CoA-carboxylase ligase, partial [Desulfovibrio sp.]|nr:biotin--acetyl-CoA-carboxylase ligase [Desulfovibrio sp.]